MGSGQGDETMVKRTEPVKHAVTKAKDVVAKGVHMKRPEAKKAVSLEKVVRKALVVDLTAKAVARPGHAPKAPEVVGKEKPGRKPKANEEQVLGTDAADVVP